MLDIFHFCENQTIDSDAEAPNKKGGIHEVEDGVEKAVRFILARILEGALFEVTPGWFFDVGFSTRGKKIEVRKYRHYENGMIFLPAPACCSADG